MPSSPTRPKLNKINFTWQHGLINKNEITLHIHSKEEEFHLLLEYRFGTEKNQETKGVGNYEHSP